MTDLVWINDIDERILSFLSSLKKNEKPGRYLPCLSGATTEGKKAALGFSCFALKIYYMLGQWEKLEKDEQNEWISYIKSFQNRDSIIQKQLIKKNAFIDPILIKYLESNSQNLSLRTFLRKYLKQRKTRQFLTNIERVIIAETKQALATLAEVGEYSEVPYNQYPKTPEAVCNYMEKFDWTQPWGAGGQTAALPVFFSLEAIRTMPASEVKDLKKAASLFFESIVDSETGGYFTGNRPEHGMLINGAMKVLTALDWLGEPIHYPETLIKTTLEKAPRADGCHLVDAVYVLHRCFSQTHYNYDKIVKFSLSILDMIKSHHCKDGGFSYGIRTAQNSYYGLPISKGLNEGDIHGTILLTWALAMILDLTNHNYNWNIIRP